MDDSTQDPYGPLNELKKPSNVFTAVRELQAAQQPQDSAQADASEEVFASTGVMVVDELIAPAPDVTVLDPTDTTFYGAGVTGGGRTFGSLIMNFWAVAAGVLQVGFNNLGQLLAGAGAVIIDATGINILRGALASNSIEWFDGVNLAGYVNDDGDATSNAIAMIALRAGVINEAIVTAYGDGGAGTKNTSMRMTGGKTGTSSLWSVNLGSGIVTRISDTNIDINYSQGNIDTSIYGASATPIVKVDTTNLSATITGFLTLATSGVLTIATGAVTASGSRHTVDTQGGAATDDLDTINGGIPGSILILSTVNNARDVTAKDGTGNLLLAGDFVMDTAQDTLTLLRLNATNWVEIARSNNA